MITLHIHIATLESEPHPGQPFTHGERLVSRRLSVQVPEGARVRSIDVRSEGPSGPDGHVVAWVGDRGRAPQSFYFRGFFDHTNTVGYIDDEPLYGERP